MKYWLSFKLSPCLSSLLLPPLTDHRKKGLSVFRKYSHNTNQAIEINIKKNKCIPLTFMYLSNNLTGLSLRSWERSLRPTLNGFLSSSCRCKCMCRRRSVSIPRHRGSSKFWKENYVKVLWYKMWSNVKTMLSINTDFLNTARRIYSIKKIINHNKPAIHLFLLIFYSLQDEKGKQVLQVYTSMKINIDFNLTSFIWLYISLSNESSRSYGDCRCLTHNIGWTQSLRAPTIYWNKNQIFFN